MNEIIEKLYKNAGVEKCTSYMRTLQTCKKDCEDCEYNWYPEFDADKQLDLVKIMLGKGIYYDVDKEHNEYWFHLTDDIENASYKPFDEAIAEFINIIWEDFTTEEKEYIKEVLSYYE